MRSEDEHWKGATGLARIEDLPNDRSTLWPFARSLGACWQATGLPLKPEIMTHRWDTGLDENARESIVPCERPSRARRHAATVFVTASIRKVTNGREAII